MTEPTTHPTAFCQEHAGAIDHVERESPAIRLAVTESGRCTRFARSNMGCLDSSQQGGSGRHGEYEADGIGSGDYSC